MPYIRERERNRLLRYEGWKEPQSPGDMNYLFTVIADNYITSKGKAYQTFNDIIGALEGCKLEVYRRMVAPYEDKKIKENGDVYNGIEQQAEERNSTT